MNKLLLILIILQTLSAYVIINSSQRPTPGETISQQSTQMPGVLTRKAGCDAILANCGPNGRCCDEHDNCWIINKCTIWSWLPGIDGLNCWNCNWNAMKCAVMQNPGVSSCCSEGTCGMDN